MKFIIINGPNMNMVGVREKEKYGSVALDDMNGEIGRFAEKLEISVEFFQSNVEGEIISKIHESCKSFDGIIINPAAFTHYSIAILDALNSVSLPSVEVHMTNIFAREEIRRRTVTAAGCIGVIAGFGKDVYNLAINALYSYIKDGR